MTYIILETASSTVMLVAKAVVTKLDLFQEADLAGNLADSKSTSGGVSCIFGGHTFVPISWVSKLQTVVSDSSTEAECISPHAGLGIEGMPALR